MENKVDTMDEIDLIMALEGGEVIVKDLNDWERIKNLCKDWSRSQGFYGRMYQSMKEFEELNNVEEVLPIVM